jgi:hypothetical protein
MPSISTSAGIGARAAAALRPNHTTLSSAQRIGLIALGLLWLLDGLLQLQPYFFHHFIGGVIAPNASGQPGIIGDPITMIANLLKPVQAPFNAFAAIIEVAIGAALLTRRALKPVLLISFAWALGIWFAGEGLGGIFTSSTPNAFTGVIGTAPLYIVAGLIAWPREQRPGRASAATGLLGRSATRAVWVVLWMAAAASWLLPSNDGPEALHDLFSGAPSGTGWLSSVHSSAASAVAGQGTGLAIALAIVSAAIGISVMFSRTERIGLIAAIGLLLIGWVLVEGVGALFTGTATDVGTNPLMILLAVQLFALSVERAPNAVRDRAVPEAAVA